MLWSNMQKRDWEILRTLYRLRFVTTSQIAATFFANPTVARRRIKRLADLDLIVTHRKGVPTMLQFFAWRLTPRGIEAVADGFPDEPVAEGLAERLVDTSLYNLEHRAGLTNIYLKLLSSPVGTIPPDAALRAIHAVMDAQRARAAQLWWQPDGDVVLKVARLGQEAQIVPDATLAGRYRHVRIFLELDRATRGLTRIRENLERYAWFLANGYAAHFDDLTPTLLYVAPSAVRKAGIAEHAQQILGSRASWAVVTQDEAPAWLEQELVDPDHDAPAVHDQDSPGASDAVERLRQAAHNVYAWACTYERQLKAEGLALPTEARAVFGDLRRELKGDAAGGGRAG